MTILYSVRLNLKKERFLKKRRCLCGHQRCSGWFIPQYEDQGNCPIDIYYNGKKPYKDITQVEKPENYEVLEKSARDTYQVVTWRPIERVVIVTTEIGSLAFEDKERTWNLTHPFYALRQIATHLSPNGIDVIE